MGPQLILEEWNERTVCIPQICLLKSSRDPPGCVFFFFPSPLAYLRLSKHKVYSGAPRWEKCLQGISLARVRGFTCTGGETVQAKVNRATITLPVGTQGCWREALVHGNIRQSLWAQHCALGNPRSHNLVFLFIPLLCLCGTKISNGTWRASDVPSFCGRQ